MTIETKVAATTAESQTASANVTVGALGQMLGERKSKRASSTPAKTSDNQPAAATESEQTGAAEGDTNDKQTETPLESELTKPEAKDAPEGEAPATDGDGEGEGTDDGDEPSKAVRKMQKRIDKLTAKLTAAEERADAEALQTARLLKQEQEAVQSTVKRADPMDEQFARDPEVVDLEGQLAGLDNFMEWATDNPGGGTFTEHGKSYELGIDALKQYRLQSERNARRLESRREGRMESLRTQFRDARLSNHAAAVKLYPWIEQKESAEFQEAVSILRNNQALMQKPDFELVVARMVAGERLERETLKKLQPGTPKPRPAVSTIPTKVVTQTLNATPRVNGPRKAAEAAEQKFAASGRVEDLTNLLAQRRSDRLKAANSV